MRQGQAVHKGRRGFATGLGIHPGSQQTVNHGFIICLGKEGADRLGHFQPHVRDRQQQQQWRPTDTVQIAETVRQILGSLFTDLQDPQGKQKTPQPHGLGVFQRGDQVIRRFLTHAFQAGHLFCFEPVQIRHGGNQLLIHQRIHQLVAQAINIHGPA